MRLRCAMLCAAASSLALAAVPGLAGAAPQHNRGLTINATPNPIDAGEGVVIYGQLKGSNDTGQTIVLYHHVVGSHRGYTVIGRTKTDSRGYYEFIKQENVVETNRSWFVRLAGHPRIHSRTVHERVRALVTIAASSSTGDTHHALTFTGHVTPDHAGQRVVLQEQVAGDDWRTLKAGHLDAASDYSIKYMWRTAGDHVVRAVFPGDARNVRGESDSVSVVIQQTQNAGFTISTTTPAITYGATAQITGTLYSSGTTPAQGKAVELCRRLLTSQTWTCGTTANTNTTTGADGSYSFTVQPTQNAWYYVKTVQAPHKRTSQLFIGVKDIITLQDSSSSGTVGHPDMFSGVVTPNKAGDFVLLQYKGKDGDWHTLNVTRVKTDGTYLITRDFGYPGTKLFRTRILSDRTNLGAVSNTVTVTVSPAPAETLAPAS